MKVILKKNVPKLGKIGDVKNVADGFARNYLFPKNLVLPYSEGTLKGFEKRRSKVQTEVKNTEKQALELKTKFEAVRLEFPVLVDAKGDLYGSVGKSQILKSLKSKGLALPRQARIELNEPLKTTGDFEVPVELCSTVTAKVKVALVKSETAQ